MPYERHSGDCCRKCSCRYNRPSPAYYPKDGPGEEILIFIRVEIERLNYRFPTARLGGDEAPLRISKLERRGEDCKGLDCNRWCFKVVIENCRKILEES